jgi:hypothetical protein
MALLPPAHAWGLLEHRTGVRSMGEGKTGCDAALLARSGTHRAALAIPVYHARQSEASMLPETDNR